MSVRKPRRKIGNLDYFKLHLQNPIKSTKRKANEGFTLKYFAELKKQT